MTINEKILALMEQDKKDFIQRFDNTDDNGKNLYYYKKIKQETISYGMWFFYGSIFSSICIYNFNFLTGLSLGILLTFSFLLCPIPLITSLHYGIFGLSFMSKKKKTTIIKARKNNWIFNSFLEEKISKEFINKISDILTKDQLKIFLKSNKIPTYSNFIIFCESENIFNDNKNSKFSIEEKKKNKIVDDLVEAIHREK